MLTDNANQTKDQIEDLRRLREIARQAQAFASRADQLGAPIAPLRMFVNLLAEFQKRNVPVDLGDTVSQARSLRLRVNTLRQTFQQDPPSILDAAPELRYAFWEPLAELPQRIREKLNRAWERYVDATLPPTQEDLLSTLEAVPGFQPRVATIRQLYRSGQTCRARLPRSSADFGEVERIAADLTRAWRELAGDGIPEEVLAFLRVACAGPGARIDQLTQQVRDWLDHYQLTSLARITLRARSGPSGYGR